MDNRSCADGTMSIRLVQLQWRLIAEHLQLIEISMINIRIWRENQRENVSSTVLHRQCHGRGDGDTDCLLVATVASLDQNALDVNAESILATTWT